ncbi:MAG: peptidoglycan-binding protein [Bauldia sp.]
MPEAKSRARTAARRDEREQFAGGGALAGFVDRVFENPAMSGGMVVMALTAAAIVSNAMFLQSARHPDPIFSTRPAEVASPRKTHAAVPIPRSRADHVGSIAPLPKSPPDLDKPAAPPPPPAALVADLQRALAGKGLYHGAVDGKFGAQTRTAIAAFEAQEGLPATGEPTRLILDRAKAVPQGPPETVVERMPDPIAARTAEPDPIPALGLEPDAAPAPAVVDQRKPEPVVAMRTPEAAEPAAPIRPAATPRPQIGPEVIEESRYRRVQAALNDIGYGPVSVDGRESEETTDAIRRFELDNGLPLKGTANDRVIARLIKIGAIPAN